MKKTMIRVLSLVLCAVLLSGAMCISAFADSDSGVPHYGYYAVLGDSNASGYGLDAYFENAGSRYTVKEGDLIEGTYAAIIADAVGADTVSVRSHSGWRTNELLRMLGYSDNYDTDPYAAYYTRDYFYTALNFASYASLEGESERVCQAVSDADLITLNIGSNDIFSYGLFTTIQRFMYVLGDVSVQPQSIEELVDMLSLILSRAEEDEMYGILTELVEACETGLANYKKNLPVLIKAITDRNPDADVVVVGMMNPIAMYIDLSDDFSIPLYQLPDLTVLRANEYAKSVCRDYGIMYADVSEARSFGVEAVDTEMLMDLNPDVVFSMLKMLHPTEESHQYMAAQILDVLKANAITPALTARYSTGLKRITLEWNEIDGAARYRVYRASSQDGSYSYIGMSANETFYDCTAIRGRTYYYKVNALMDVCGSVITPYSNIVSIEAK